jgi:NADPH-dependent 2,4-dienoyl-CoA reductase/sulfur reductase-like enzyme
MIDLAIIGAGPAGISAALAAAAHGASVLVIDEQRRPGGQIFRRPPKEFTGAKTKFSAGYPWARALLDEAENHPFITWKHGTTAFGIFRDKEDGNDQIQLAVSGPGGAERIPAKRVLIATGAYYLPVAIPGWTLPGVMMAGAVQGFIKSQRLVAGKRLVLAGSHPLLIVVADQLLASGADIAEVAFARGLPRVAEAARSLPAVPGHLPLFAETGMAVARLIKAGVKISTNTIATRAIGKDLVEAVELSPVDKNWNVTGAPRLIDATTLVLGYGFLPSTELARQAGCEMQWDSPKGGWVVAHDDRMQTSSPGIYVAGEPTGVAGAEQSRAEGTLAGAAIAEDLRLAKRAVATKEIAAARRKVRQAEHFSTVVQQMFEPRREALAALATPETIVCRCEEITCGHIKEVLAENPQMSTASAVKLECRSGMGPCQGRYCEITVSSIVSVERGRPSSQVGAFTAYIPVKPVPVAALTVLDDAHDL